MDKKIFTLIYGDQIRIAPRKKIISGDSLSILQDASEVMDRIQEDANKYRLQVTKETEEIKESGFKQGFEEGFNQWTEQLAQFEKQLREVQDQLQKMIIPIALKAARKIVGREIELSTETIVDIVISNLKSVKQHKKVAIFVNKKDLAALENQKPRLRELFEHLESLSIRPRDDIEVGGCVIETEVGIINAQLEHRWKALEKAFESLMKTAPETLKEI